MKERIQIQLVDRKRDDVEKIEVNTQAMMNATMIVVDGKHYAYHTARLSDNMIVFMEADPPLVIREKKS